MLIGHIHFLESRKANITVFADISIYRTVVSVLCSKSTTQTKIEQKVSTYKRLKTSQTFRTFYSWTHDSQTKQQAQINGNNLRHVCTVKRCVNFFSFLIFFFTCRLHDKYTNGRRKVVYILVIWHTVYIQCTKAV